MKPDPSIRIRCSFWSRTVASPGSRTVLVSGAVTCSFVQHIEARAVGAQDGSVLNVEEHPRMAQRNVAAVAGDHPIVDMDDFGRRRAGGGAVHLAASHPLWRGRAV